MRVAVLCGGRSSEHDVSLASGRSVSAALRAAGHDVLDVTIDRAGVWRHDEASLAVAPGQGLLGADVAFPILHGPYGEDGTVQGLLECLDVPYIGSGVLASAVCMDKLVFKELMARAGLPQVRYAAALLERWRDAAHGRAELEAQIAALGLPVFVKPARLGSSVGIARVARADELAGALDEAFVHDPRVIVEAMATGLEVECSVLGHSAAEASEPGEIVLAGRAEGAWYDFAAKYTPGGMELVVPARISARARERVRALALETFTRFSCSGLARVDFFVAGDEVLVNELNTMPGFTQTSVYASLLAASGVDYGALLERLAQYALERHAEERAFRG